MRIAIGLLCGALILTLGPVGCAKKKERAAAPAPAAPGKMPEPLAQQAAPKEEPKKPVETKEQPPAAKDPNVPPTPTKTPIRGGSIVRRVDVADVKNLLRQLHIASKNFETERNRYPNSREELEPYYEMNPKINELLKEGDLVFLWKALKTEEPDKTVLAYEGQPDTAGIRVVLFANGDTQQISEAEFKGLKKMPTRK